MWYGRLDREGHATGALPPGLDLGRVLVEPPRDPSHGDLATNAAMVLAKAAGTNPRRGASAGSTPSVTRSSSTSSRSAAYWA